MMKVALGPDTLNLRHAALRNQLPPCPFCGTDSPLVMDYVNEDTLSGLALYQTIVECTNYRTCGASVLANEHTRADAQQAAMTKWRRRAAPSSETP